MNLILRVLIILIGVFNITACNTGSSNTQNSNQVPTLDPDSLNLIFVQSMESNGASLSITGYNHSLLFGQILTQVTGGNTQQIYALNPESQIVNNFPNMAPIQSIENYAVLNTFGIAATLPNSATDMASMIESTIISNVLGTYVFAAPADLINYTLSIMSKNPSLYFTFTPITNSSQYIIVTTKNLQEVVATTYSDGINPASTFPQVDVKTGAACTQKSVTYTFDTPPSNINKNETVYLIRHTEAHPVQSFDNGNYVCQGQWRNFAYPPILFQKMMGLPDSVYSSDPAEPTSYQLVSTYIRPSLNANSFTIYYSMPLNLVDQFYYSNYESMAQFFFSGGQFDNQKLLVVWEHDAINNSIEYLIESMYNQSLPADFPVWRQDEYDAIWKVRLESDGRMIFSNTCEGIATPSLPLDCPMF